MITIKQYDTGIGIKVTLTNEDGAVDLTDATVLFFMGSNVIYPVVTDADKGELLVVFERKHTAKTGRQRAEFRVTHSDNRVESFPSDSYLEVNIMQHLGGEHHGR